MRTSIEVAKEIAQKIQERENPDKVINAAVLSIIEEIETLQRLGISYKELTETLNVLF